METTIKKEVEWDKVDENIIKRVVEDGENFLRGTLEASQTLDRKASILMTTMLGISVPVIGITVSAFSKYDFSVFLTCVAFLILAYVVNRILLLVVMPMSYKFLGNKPENWYKDAGPDQNLYVSKKVALGRITPIIDMAIDTNLQQDKLKSKYLSKAIAYLVVSPLWLTGIYLLSSFLIFWDKQNYNLLNHLLVFLGLPPLA